MKKYITPILLAIVFLSCEDVIEVDINESDLDLYAVEAKITTIDEPTVFLTKAMSVTVDEAYTGTGTVKFGFGTEYVAIYPSAADHRRTPGPGSAWRR